MILLSRREEHTVTKLYFEKISKYDRAKEPVHVSIPFARGRLRDPGRLVIRDGERTLPVQARVLANWPDGSIKWLIVHFQPDLPGNLDKSLQFAITEKPAQASALEERIKVTDTAQGLLVDTGPLSFRVPRGGFLPLADVRLNGKLLWGGAFLGGFTLRHDGEELATGDGEVELELEETGPLCAVILLKGKHRRADGSGYLELRGRITAYAGKPYVDIEHQLIHAENEPELALEELRLDVRPQATGTPRLALGEGYYRTNIRAGEEPLEMTIDAETLLYQSNEHYVDCFYGDFWIDWRDDLAGLTLSIYQAHQNFPKKLRVTPDGMTAYLYPPEVAPARLLQGMAKTHRLRLHFHAPDASLEELAASSLQFQLPDHPALPADWYRENNPWGLDFIPERVPDRLLTMLSRRHDQRPEAMGMFHFGDAPDAGYTDQGRGRGLTVWVNNEYDRPHACALFYALTGQRRVLDSGLVAARHWMDVDLCHYSENPLHHGGLKIHTAYHVTGGVTPSHEWVEGLLDYYYLTGRREGLEAAYSVAENIMRHTAQPHMREPGAASVRENGWALRAIVAMALATGEERFHREARRIVDLFLSWEEMYGGMLAPYTSHSMPRVVFMIGLTMNSLARYLLLEDDDRVKRLIVSVVDDLIAYCLTPGGIFYYKELPSLRRPAPTVHAIEALTHAYRFTHQRRYLEIATRQFFAYAEGGERGSGGPKRVDESGAVIRGHGGGRPFADAYTSLILFAGAATPQGLLDWYEYPV